MDKTLKDQIRNLVSNAKTEQALEAFIQWANTSNSDLSNDLIGVKSQFSSLKRNENLGLISYSEANIKRAQISNGILQILESADDSVPQAIVFQTTTQSTASSSGSASTNTVPGESNVILFLASNPWNTAKLQLEKEFTKVFNNLQNSKFVVKSEFAVTPSSLQKAILKYKPRVIHFSGHGLSDSDVSTIQNPDERAIAKAAKGGAGIVLQDETGKAKVMETKNLISMFQIFTKFKIPIDTVIFNSCHSRAQADGIRNYVNYVVGYSNAIKDDAAILIANEFYSYFSENDNAEFAYELTKNIVNVEGFSEDQLMELLKRDGL